MKRAQQANNDDGHGISFGGDGVMEVSSKDQLQHAIAHPGMRVPIRCPIAAATFLCFCFIIKRNQNCLMLRSKAYLQEICVLEHRDCGCKTVHMFTCICVCGVASLVTIYVICCSLLFWQVWLWYSSLPNGMINAVKSPLSSMACTSATLP